MLRRDDTQLTELPEMQIAVRLAEACKTAYFGETAVRWLAEDWGWEVVDWLRKESREAASIGQAADEWGFAARGQGALILVFHGADSLANWLAHVSTEEKAPFGGGECNEGILGEFNALRPALERIIEAARADNPPVFCTGHAIGGALALLAAADIAAGSRLFTFGQPRILDKAAAEKADERLGSNYWRFVNRDDIVPTLIPGLKHAGRCIQLDLGGGDAAAAEMPEIAEPDFQDMRRTITQIRSDVRNSGQSSRINSGALVAASIEDKIPGILNHRIDRYIDSLLPLSRREQREARDKAIDVAGDRISDPISDPAARPSMLDTPVSRDLRSYLNLNLPQIVARSARRLGSAAAGGLRSLRSALSLPQIQPEPSSGETKYAEAPRSPDDGTPCIPAVLQVVVGWKPPAGLRVLSDLKKFPETVSVLMTAEQHNQLRADDQVLQIEISRDAGLPDIIRSIKYCGGDKVNAVKPPAIAEKGDKCWFALIDTGVDVLHDAFSDGNGGTRIRAIWHQAGQGGKSPHKLDPANFGQDYGRLYLGDEINDMIRSFRKDRNPVSDILRDQINLFSSGHGTHVASIGAGGPFGDIQGGMAPDAPIIVVIPKLHTDKTSPESLGYSLTHVDALHFLASVANAETKVSAERLPMVVNISLGMNAGPHDGRTPLEVAFTRATDDGTRRGFAIVKSAGNECGEGRHVRVDVLPKTRSIISWSGDAPREKEHIEAWYRGDKLKFRLRPPGVGPDDHTTKIAVDRTPKNREASLSFGGNTIEMELAPNTGHGDRLTMEITRADNPIGPGSWELDVFCEDVSAEGGVVDAWIERLSNRSVRFERDDDDFTISIPGTVRSVVCVGAGDCHKDFAAIGTFSSRGPTRDGLLKPDITAPGVEILAAKAGKDGTSTTTMSGTSMAAPHVAGAFVLAMSRRHKLISTDATKRQFNANQLREMAVRSARDKTRHCRHWGYGKLDVEAFFLEAETTP